LTLTQTKKQGGLGHVNNGEHWRLYGKGNANFVCHRFDLLSLRVMAGKEPPHHALTLGGC
jgi:hypothetical protein